MGKKCSLGSMGNIMNDFKKMMKVAAILKFYNSGHRDTKTLAYVSGMSRRTIQRWIKKYGRETGIVF